MTYVLISLTTGLSSTLVKVWVLQIGPLPAEAACNKHKTGVSCLLSLACCNTSGLLVNLARRYTLNKTRSANRVAKHVQTFKLLQ